MDRLLNEFRCNNELHQKVVSHLISKRVPTNEAYLFCQPEAWEILADKIESGEYHFKPLIEGYVDKRNGAGMSYEQAKKRNFEDVRMIYMFEHMDRAVAHMLYLLYYEEFIGLSHERCVSYKVGIGTSTVAKKLSLEMNKKQYFKGKKGDIHHYFDDVNMKAIEKWLLKMKTGSVLDDLLWELYHDDRVLVNGELIHRHRGLIQGCAFACLLANLVLSEMDEKLSKMDLIYYRYSDDFIILSNNDKIIEKAMGVIKHELATNGLQLHPKKVSDINAYDDWFEFLGFSFHRDYVSLGSKTLKNLVTEIKTRSMSRTRQAHRPATEQELRKAIKDLQSYFFTAFAADEEQFGMGVYLFGTVNVVHDLVAIENYCKDCLRAMYTNRSNIYGLGYVNRKGYVIDDNNIGKNCKANNEKTGKGTDDDILKKCGWVSLMKMYNDYHTDMDLFNSSVHRMSKGLM